MEYCGAGSVSDIMRLRKKTLTEDEISTVLTDTLRGTYIFYICYDKSYKIFSYPGLEYLHARKKIHRDIKVRNLLNRGLKCCDTLNLTFSILLRPETFC